MVCPKCGSGNIRVIDKRDNIENNNIRRRRECKACEFRFTTYEKIENINFLVKKRSGKIEEFKRKKLKISLLKGLKKRNCSLQDIERIIDKIEINLRNKKKHILNSKEIGKEVLKILKNFDKVAYMLYATVYKDYENLIEIEKEIKNLQEK